MAKTAPGLRVVPVDRQLIPHKYRLAILLEPPSTTHVQESFYNRKPDEESSLCINFAS
jgi:hypothetical protein